MSNWTLIVFFIIGLIIMFILNKLNIHGRFFDFWIGFIVGIPIGRLLFNLFVYLHNKIF
jgi:uncharacterized membrane protein YeaQ/YmgE (transglycosylase-associated protein family)